MFVESFMECLIQSIAGLKKEIIDAMANGLNDVRRMGGRVFVVGSGGGAGHASHAVCDMRRLAGLEAYAPSDNISELTALANDFGWDKSCSLWLEESHVGPRDALVVFSVGGGSVAPPVSANLVNAIAYANRSRARVYSIVGPRGGFAEMNSTLCLKIPCSDAALVTPIVESLQAAVWHLLVSSPVLNVRQAKWEGLNVH